MGELFNRLPGFQQTPAGQERDVLRRLPKALTLGTLLLCLPSLERTEAFGMVLLEAMRFGKPVVVGDIPGSGPGWVVRQAGHGLLTPPGDTAALAAALRELQRDPARRQTLGQSGASALRQRFGSDRVALAVADLYRRVLAAARTVERR